MSFVNSSTVQIHTAFAFAAAFGVFDTERVETTSEENLANSSSFLSIDDRQLALF